MKNILFAASEAVPFIKTGGLADVVGALPRYCDKKYYDCRIIIPKYLCMKESNAEKLNYITNFYLNYNGRDRYVGLFSCEENGVTYYFIDNEEYFGGPAPYGDWLYDIEKFIFFSLAVLSALPVLGFKPDVIHCNDWQTGLIPVYLDARFKAGEFFKDIKTVFTIHNLKFQGAWDVKTIQNYSGLDGYYFTPDKLECQNSANLLKGGVVYADAITTVSETYAKEIQTPYYGEGLDGLMRARDNSLRGIVNGIDYEVFNPKTDKNIFCDYSVDTFRKDKVKNKLKLQEEYGLTRDSRKFMIGIVSRLTSQKGLDLVRHVFEEIMTEDTQFVVLGTGEYEYEEFFRNAASRMPDRVCVNTYYSEELAHKIYASCDAYLMPSQFEPCGLSQLIALRYGTVPIVRETGGLKDTVEAYNEFENKGTGFSFANYNAHEMLYTIQYARNIFRDKKRSWNKIVERGMKKDFSWSQAALKYQELYDWLIGY